MTAVLDIIKAAFREGNITAVGAAPSGGELDEGLALFNRYLNSVYGFVLGENLRDWQVPVNQRTGQQVDADPPYLPGGNVPIVTLQNEYPSQNSRIVWNGAAVTVYFPQTPDDGARMGFVKSSGGGYAIPGTLTLDGNGRTIEGALTYTPGAVTTRAWLYRADLADWVAMRQFQLNDADIPFPPEFDDLWITAIAIRMAPRYGKQTTPETLATNKRMAATLKARYQQYMPEGAGGEELRGSYQSYYNTWRNDIF